MYEHQAVVDPKTGEVGLPEDHEEQFQLGMRMIQGAYQKKVQELEQEVRSLRHACEEQCNTTAMLQKKNMSLESELLESHHRAQAFAEENKELFKTVGTLRKQNT